jgi:hypothetical protein
MTCWHWELIGGFGSSLCWRESYSRPKKEARRTGQFRPDFVCNASTWNLFVSSRLSLSPLSLSPLSPIRSSNHDAHQHRPPHSHPPYRLIHNLPQVRVISISGIQKAGRGSSSRRSSFAGSCCVGWICSHCWTSGGGALGPLFDLFVHQ